jgi:BCD family chlorophyll transporter-like MFS transporter
MLIAGAIVTSIGTGVALEPYAPEKLVPVVGTAAALAFLITLLATWRMDRHTPAVAPTPPLRAALREVWDDPAARRFTGFVFLSILAFYLSELIFEPFTGHVHGLAPDESTVLSGAKDGAALLGMLGAGLLTQLRIGSLRLWAVVGCAVSAVGLIGLGSGAPLTAATLTLGFGNGLFVVGAIGSMMRLAAGRAGAAGTTMGVFGAAQAIAAGLAGLAATATLDLLRALLPDATAYGALFAIEAALFLAAALMAARILGPAPAPAPVPGE